MNFAFLFIFLGAWLFSYMQPVLKGLVQDDHLFYGTVTHASIPSVFGGTDIPFLDKTMFRINGDDKVTFYLYASKEMMDDMSDWFSFAAKNAGEIPLEIGAARVSENKFVVHSISSTDGDLEFDDLVMDYQVYYGFIGVCIVGGMWILALVLLILWLVKRRRENAGNIG